MTTKRTGDPWMPSDDYGRSLPPFSVNLLVRNLVRSIEFYRDVLGATVQYSDADFAALRIGSLEFMLHADHAYDGHSWATPLAAGGLRGLGAELRLLGVNPDEVEARARQKGARVLQSAQDEPHGWRDTIVCDPDGYTWAVGLLLTKS